MKEKPKIRSQKHQQTLKSSSPEVPVACELIEGTNIPLDRERRRLLEALVEQALRPRFEGLPVIFPPFPLINAKRQKSRKAWFCEMCGKLFKKGEERIVLSIGFRIVAKFPKGNEKTMSHKLSFCNIEELEKFLEIRELKLRVDEMRIDNDAEEDCRRTREQPYC